MLGTLIRTLERGISVNGYTISSHKVFPGRFREEQNVEIYYRVHNKESFLLNAKVFHGRLPDYHPWVELFDIEKILSLDGTHLSYFESSLETILLQEFSETLGPGAKLFVEYYSDIETKKELQTGIPVVLSRLGYKMFNLGFTWFKDWYFPEGYMEGNQKLQGEKPINAATREKHVRNIMEDIDQFVRDTGFSKNDYRIGLNALKRASEIMSAVKI